MNKTTEALKLAKEALYAELESDTYEEFAEAAEKCHKALAAIRDALAEHPMDYDQGFVDGVEAQLAEPEVTDTKITDCKSEQMPVGYIYNDITSECIPVYAALVREDAIDKLNRQMNLACEEARLLDHSGEAADMVQEPVAWGEVVLREGDVTVSGYLYGQLPVGTKLYTAPPTAALAARQIAAEIADFCSDIDGGENMFSRAIRKKYGVE